MATKAVVDTAVGLIRAAGAVARPAYLAVAVLWPVSVALTVRFAPMEKVAKGDPTSIAVMILAAILPAIAGALATRTLLGAAKPWRLDSGLAAYVAIEAGMALAWDRLFALGGLEEGAKAVQLPPLTAITLFVGALGLVLATLYWQLWPVGRVMGDRTMTPMRSVQQMVGAVGASILASLLLAGAAGFLMAAFAAAVAQTLGASDETAVIILSVALTPAQILGLAVTAAVWRLRNGAQVDQVFD